MAVQGWRERLVDQRREPVRDHQVGVPEHIFDGAVFAADTDTAGDQACQR